MKQPERLLVTILLVTNLADIAGLLLITRRLVQSLGVIGYPLALLLAGPIYLFMLGVLPKSLFRRFPYRALAALAGLLEFTSRVFWPILELGARIGGLCLPQKESTPRMFVAREDLKQLTVESELQGALTSAERAMIHNVVDFRTVKVADVMRPLRKVISGAAGDERAGAVATQCANRGRPGAGDLGERPRARFGQRLRYSARARRRVGRCATIRGASSPRARTNPLTASSAGCAPRGSRSPPWSMPAKNSPASSRWKIS